MKKIALMLAIILWSNVSLSQTDPTLAVGLETLTYGKGTIDVELLTEIIMEKQKELKQEALKRFMFNLFPEGNYTTKFYMQNALHILLNEQNPEVIKKELMEILTNYSLALGFTIAYREVQAEQLESISSAINDAKTITDLRLKNFDDYLQKKKWGLFNSRIDKLENDIRDKEQALNSSLSRKIEKFLTYKSQVKQFKNDLEEGATLENTLQKYTDDKAIFYSETNPLDSIIIKEITTLDVAIGNLTYLVDGIKRFQIAETIGTINSAEISDDLLAKLKASVTIKPISKIKTNISDIRKLAENSEYYGIITNVIEKIDELETVENRVVFEKDLHNLYETFEKELLAEKKQRKTIESLKNRLAKKRFRRALPATEQVEIRLNKEVIPFGILLDVVATALSDNKELQRKGFFKQKIDYRLNPALDKYINANNEINEIQELENLKDDIDNTIKVYVDNFQVLKEIKNNIEDLREELNNGGNVFEIITERFLKEFEAQFLELSLNEISAVYDDLIDADDETTAKNIKTQLRKILNDFSKIESLAANINETIEFLENYEKRIQLIARYQDTDINNITQEEQTLIDNIIIEAQNLDRYFDELKLVDKIFETFQNEVETTIKNGTQQVLNLKDSNLSDFDKELNEFTTSGTLDIKILNESNTSRRDNLNIDLKKKVENIKSISNWLTDNNAKNDTKNALQTFKQNTVEPMKSTISKRILDYYKSDTGKTKSKKILDILLIQLKENIENKPLVINGKDTTSLKKMTTFTKAFYKKVNTLLKQERIKMSDIYHLQNDLLPEIIALKILSPESEKTLSDWQNKIDQILPFLNIKAIDQIGKNQSITIEQIEKGVELFEFIINLDNLDKAETFEHILNLFRDGNEIINDNLKDGEFKNVYNLFSNAIKKYTLINTAEQYIEIDVASFLVELEEYYDKNNDGRWGFYLSVGLNQNWFINNDVKLPDDSDPVRKVALASEKLGVQFRLLTFDRSSDYTNVVPNDIYLSKRSPFVNDWYLNLYGSGLLYSLANASTNQNFDAPIIGLGTGIRFFNALDFNVNLNLPFIEGREKPFKDLFFGIGFDIPLSEYLTKSKAKRSKAKKN